MDFQKWKNHFTILGALVTFGKDAFKRKCPTNMIVKILRFFNYIFPFGLNRVSNSWVFWKKFILHLVFEQTRSEKFFYEMDFSSYVFLCGFFITDADSCGEIVFEGGDVIKRVNNGKYID